MRLLGSLHKEPIRAFPTKALGKHSRFHSRHWSNISNWNALLLVWSFVANTNPNLVRYQAHHHRFIRDWTRSCRSDGSTHSRVYNGIGRSSTLAVRSLHSPSDDRPRLPGNCRYVKTRASQPQVGWDTKVPSRLSIHISSTVLICLVGLFVGRVSIKTSFPLPWSIIT
jgi:hypothetical protein